MGPHSDKGCGPIDVPGRAAHAAAAESSTLAAVSEQSDPQQRPAVQHSADVPPVAKGVAFFLVGVVAIHFAFTFLFNAPSNPVKDVLGGQVSSYMQPMFQQNWSLFAPNPVNSEDEVLVRAELSGPESGPDAGTPTVTEWESATALEWSIITHDPVPSRASRLSSNLHRRLNSAWNRLNDDQHRVLAEDFAYMPDWTPLADALARAAGGSPSPDIATMVRADRVATGYATQFARARWGDDVTSVQFQIRRTPVPRWADRLGPDTDPATGTVHEFGWRPVLVNEGQDDDLFARTIDGLS